MIANEDDSYDTHFSNVIFLDWGREQREQGKLPKRNKLANMQKACAEKRAADLRKIRAANNESVTNQYRLKKPD